MSYNLYDGSDAIEIVERSDPLGSLQFETEWSEVERLLADRELADVLYAIGDLAVPPVDADHACEVLDMRYETHVLRVMTGPWRIFVLFAYEIAASRITLLGIELTNILSQFGLRERARLETIRAFGLVNPVRESLDQL